MLLVSLFSLTSLTAVTHNCCRTLFALVRMTTTIRVPTYLRVCAPYEYEYQGLRCCSQWRVGAGSRSGDATMGWLPLARGCHHQVRLMGLISGMSKMATTSPRLGFGYAIM
ncbi:hypothetical protein GGI35DRAFT_462354 [Trichoderma velutinum]